jgi:phytoene dehydrogenase-like protein
MTATVTRTDTYDAVVIGGGPNGLICAAYLAKAGAKVLLVERRHETGGGLNTDEYFGFRLNLHAIYHMMSDVMPAYRDLALPDFGLRYVYPHVACAFPFDDGKALLFTKDLDETVASIATVSEHDADCFRTMWNAFAPMLDQYIIPLTYRLPMPVVDQVVEIGQTEVGEELNEISDLSPIEVVDHYGFTDPRVRMALQSFSAMWGFHLEDPLGYLYPVYLCRMVGAALVKGGSHRMSSALYRAFVSNGGEILDTSEVVAIHPDGDGGAAVEVADGHVFSARAVASTLNPQQTFLDLVGADNIPSELRHAVQDWEWEERTLFGQHLGIEGSFSYRHPEPRVGDAMIAFVGIETEDELHEHLERVDEGTARGGEWVHVTVPSRHDRSMAPAGHELVRAEQVVRYDDDWDGGTRQFGDESLALIERHADFGRIVLRREYPPTHIEAKLHTMRRGSIKHGSYTNLQMGFNRPNDMCSQVETPVPGVFTCGASNYAGGMIIGGPGYLGAKVVGDHLGLDAVASYDETG